MKVNNTKEVVREVDFNKYPIPVMDSTGFGMHISRFMRLLDESTTKNPSWLKIAFTGQSITDTNNTWPVDLTAWLRKKYPTAEIVCQNFAIGGFSTNYLLKRMPNDMASFYPDLVVMLDYGDKDEYERMVKWIRENTTAEIMLQTDHYCGENEYMQIMPHEYLPEIAERYDAYLCDLRTPWEKYIKENNLNPLVLLTDDVHLNEYGQTFMLEIMKQYFVCNKNGKEIVREKTIPITSKNWTNGKVTIPFDGNRVEIITQNGKIPPVNILIDGKKPSDILDAYISSGERRGMETTRGIITYKKAPGEQVFTITLNSYESNEVFSYSAESTKGGFEGKSDAHGILDGNFLYLDKESFTFHVAYDNEKDTKDRLAPGAKYKFESLLNGTNTYDGTNPYVNHPEKSKLFDPNMVISGINVGVHSITLEALSEVPDSIEIKIYCPK